MIAYKYNPYVLEAMQSIISQTYKNWQLLVVWDAADIAQAKQITARFQKDKRIKLILNKKRLGLVESRNKGLKLAKGKYIAVLDTDDLWENKQKLSLQVNFLEQNKEYVLVGGGVIVINEQGRTTRRYTNPLTDRAIRNGMLLRNPFLHSSVLFRKESALFAGGYSTEVVVGEEYVLWLNLGMLGKMANLSKPLVRYRIHSQGSCVRQRIKGAVDTMKIIMRYHHDYPWYILALGKGLLRIVYSVCLVVLDRFTQDHCTVRGSVRSK
jgi:glycosyltransferase involved in cell wall biosynthesis